MLRTIVASIAGVILSAILAAMATRFMLTRTQFGRLSTGNYSGMSDPWQAFMTGSSVAAAAVAVLPISVLGSGPALRGAWIGLVLVFCVALVAWVSQRLVRNPASV